MARLWSSGFELNSATGGVEWTLGAGGNFGTIVTAPIRSGTYAGRILSLSSGSKKGFGFLFSSTSDNGPFWARFYLRVATLPSAENTICDFEDGAFTRQCRITIDNTGVLRLYDEDGVIGSPSSALSI